MDKYSSIGKGNDGKYTRSLFGHTTSSKRNSDAEHTRALVHQSTSLIGNRDSKYAYNRSHSMDNSTNPVTTLTNDMKLNALMPQHSPVPAGGIGCGQMLGISTSSTSPGIGKGSSNKASTIHGYPAVSNSTSLQLGYGGARPKTKNKQETEPGLQKGERDYDPANYESSNRDTHSSEALLGKDKENHKVHLTVIDLVSHKEHLTISCDVETYMKWCYILRSPTKRHDTNTLLGKHKKWFLRLNSELLISSVISETSITEKELEYFIPTVIDMVGKDLIVDCISVADSIAEHTARTLVEVPRVAATNFLYAEATGSKTVHVVYIKSYEAAVKDLLETLCPKILQVRMPSILERVYKLMRLREKLSIDFPSVTFTFSVCKESDEFICEICGPLPQVQSAEKKVLLYRNNIKWQEYQLTARPLLQKACHELNLCDKIQKKIDKYLHGNCLLQETETGIFLYAFNDENISLGMNFLIKHLDEQFIHLKEKFGRLIDAQKLQQKTLEKFKGEILVFEECGNLVIAGLTEDVKRAISFIEGLIESEVERETKLFSRQVSISDTELLDILKMLAEDIATHNHVEFATSLVTEGQNFKFSGNKTDVEKTVKAFDDAKMDLKKECICVAKDFIRSEDGTEFLRVLQSNYRVKVLLDKEVVNVTQAVGGDADRGTDRTTRAAVLDKEGNRYTWTFQSGKTLILDLLDIQQCVEPDILVVMSEKKFGQSATFTKDYLHGSKQSKVELHVPKWQEGKKGERKKLNDYIRRFLSKTTEDGHTSAGLLVEPAGSWPFMSFLSVIIPPILKHLEPIGMGSSLKTIFLCTRSFDKLKKTEAIIRTGIDSDFVENNIQTEIVRGELNLFEADVLVNTTSPSLDLAYGRVSSAMLKRAGPDLQKACKKHYPKGLAGSAIAVTYGYDLDCQYVFHGALNTYRPENQENRLMELRSFLQNCLDKANELEVTSIAFPVIGSGNLGYPVLQVASEMFTSILRMKQRKTEYTLRFVYFVIYPHDKEILKIFKTVQEDMVRHKDPSGHESESGSGAGSGAGRGAGNGAGSGAGRGAGSGAGSSQTMMVTIIGLGKYIEQAVNVLEEKIKNKADGRNRGKLAHSEIPNHVKGITANQYKALLKFYPIEFEDIRDNGVELKWEDDKVQVLGNPKKVSEAINMIKELDKSVKEMFDIHISVVDLNAEDVKSGLRNISRTYRDVNVLHDKILTMVHLYGKDVEAVKNAGKLLGYDSRTVVNEDQRRKYESDGSTSREMLYKPTVERSFSWTTMAKNVKIYQLGDIVVKVYEGDLLAAPTECIVNAANKDLQHIGGVAYAIASKAGDELNKECYQKMQSGALEVGSVVETTAGKLSHKFVLHTVGPNWFDYKPITADSLKQCEHDLYRAILKTFIKAEKLQLTSVALPAISSAIFRVPREICAMQYAKAIQKLAESTTSFLKEINFVDQDSLTVKIIQEVFQCMFIDSRSYQLNAKVYYDIQQKISSISYPGNDTTGDETKGNENPSVGGMVILLNPVYRIDQEKMTCTFTTSHEIRIFTGNILNLDGIDAIVCSEDRSWSSAGMVAKKLHEMGGKEYTEAKLKARQNNPSIGDGDVVVTIGGRNKYPWVIHALIPNGKPPEALKDLAEDILEHCVRQGFKSVVMSLLGSGSGRADPVQCSQLLLTAYEHFCVRNPGYKFTLYLVNIVKEKTEVLQSVFKKHIDKQTKRRREQQESELVKASAKLGLHPSSSEERRGKPNEREHLEDINARETSQREEDKSLHRRYHADGTSIKGIGGAESGMRSTQSREQVLEEEGQGQVEVSSATKRDQNTKDGVEEITELSNNCVICMDRLDNPKTLKCGHVFCTDCIEQYFKVKQACPTCFTVCGVITGDQPNGELEIQRLRSSLAGYEDCGSLGVSYRFDDGHQGENHPHPGTWFKGIQRSAYLPNTEEGRKICAMLKLAFERRLVFTIGTSRTTGQDGVITWNDIHHKTDHRPNTQFGYPDATYLVRVKEELAAKGVLEEDIDKKLLKELVDDRHFRKRFVVK